MHTHAGKWGREKNDWLFSCPSPGDGQEDFKTIKDYFLPFAYPMEFQGHRHFIQSRRIINGCRQFVLFVVRYLLNGASQNLPGTGLGEPFYDSCGLERGHRPDAVPDHLYDFFNNLAMVTGHAGVQNQKSDGNLAFQVVFHTQNRAFGNLGIIR